MAHRLRAALLITCLAMEGAGCAWMKRKPTGEQVVMPMQTGSMLQRRIVVPMDSDQTATQKKKDSKKKKDAKKKKDSKKEESKRASAKPSSTPERTKPKSKSKPEPEPDEIPPTAPDRLR